MAWTPEQMEYARQQLIAKGYPATAWTPEQVEYAVGQTFGAPERPSKVFELPQPTEGPGIWGAYKSGLRESPTGLLLKGLPKGEEIDLDFWEKVAKGIGTFTDPISLALFFAGGGIGGAAAKKLGVEGLKRLALKRGLTGSLRSAGQLGLHGVGAEAFRQQAAGDLDPSQLAAALGKGVVTGAALGPAAALAKPLPRFAGEVATFGTVSPILEGEKPSPESFALAGATLGVMKGTHALAGLAKSRAAPKAPRATDTLQGAIRDAEQAGFGARLRKGTKPFRQFRKYWLDDLHRLQVLEEAAEKVYKGKGLELPEEMRPHQIGLISRGWSRDAFRRISDELQPLLEGLSKDEYLQLRSYYLARRIIARPDKYTTEAVEKMGIAPDDVLTTLAKVPEGSKIHQIAEQLNQYSRKLVKDTYDPDIAESIMKPNDFYAPGFRDMGPELDAVIFGPRSALGARDPIKGLKAESERPFADPIEGLLKNTYNLTRYKHFRRTAEATIKLAEVLEDPSIAKEVPKGFKGKYTVRLNRKTYEIDPEVYEAFKNVNRDALPTLLRWAGGPARLLRVGATTTPEFSFRNLFRDVYSAVIYSKNGFMPWDAAIGMCQILGKGKWWREFERSGGAFATLVSVDRPTMQRNVAELIAKGPKQTVQRIVTHPIEALRVLSTLVEESTRVGEYRLGRIKGKSKQQMAFETRDVTLDFARAGIYGRHVNALIAFWNAHVQGLDKLNRELITGFRKNPKNAAKVATKAFATITLPSVALMLLNREDPRWKDIPDWQKNMFWIVMTKDHVWRIPKPFDIGLIFGSLPERAIEWAADKDPSQADAFKQMFGASVGEAFPSPLDISAIGPLVDVYANRARFTGRPIIPRSKEKLLPPLQANKWTTRTMRELGRVMNVSPAKMEHLWKGYTAGLGRYGLDLSDALINKVAPEVKPEFARTPSDVPIKRAFAVRFPTGSGRMINQFHDLAENVEMLYKSRNEIPLGDQRAQIMRAHVRIAFYKRQLSYQWKKIERVEKNKLLSPEQRSSKRDEAYLKMSEIAEKALAELRR